MHEFQSNPDAVFANASEIAVNEEEKTDVENHRRHYRNSVEILDKLQDRGLPAFQNKNSFFDMSQLLDFDINQGIEKVEFSELPDQELTTQMNGSCTI